MLENLPFDIPDSWCWARLGDIGDWGAGATPPRGNLEYYGGNIPWVKTGELNDDYIFLSVETVSSKALQECSLRYNKIGDILIAMYGATIGKLGIAGVKLTTNQACCACTPYEGVYNIYLFYYLKEEKDRFTKLGTVLHIEIRISILNDSKVLQSLTQTVILNGISNKIG